MPKGQMHRYTDEQKQFLRDNVKNCSYHELTEAFNKKFGLNFSRDRISCRLSKWGLANGRNTQFKKGQTPANKGSKGLMKPNRTSYKKGNVPHTKVPVGTEVLMKTGRTAGYTKVKVAEPNKWKMKHIIVWETEHGEVPDGHCIIFADRNKSNFNLDNLLLVSRAELVRMNQNGYIYNNAELTKIGHTMAKIDTHIGKVQRR